MISPTLQKDILKLLSVVQFHGKNCYNKIIIFNMYITFVKKISVKIAEIG